MGEGMRQEWIWEGGWSGYDRKCDYCGCEAIHRMHLHIPPDESIWGCGTHFNIAYEDACELWGDNQFSRSQCIVLNEEQRTKMITDMFPKAGSVR